MIREADLTFYLPSYLQEYNQETVATLEAENPEFKLVWEATDKVLRNEFIATADEYGISRFEKILNILPAKEDNLESRRERVQSRWFTEVPYTLKTLISKLIVLCGDSDFEITPNLENYKIRLETRFKEYGKIMEIQNILQNFIPVNIFVEYVNYVYLEENIMLSETVYLSELQWNYTLGSWKLGLQPFVTTIEKEVIVVPSNYSVEQELLNDTAIAVFADVENARVNGNISISPLTKSISGNVTQIQYTVTPTHTNIVTRIELLDSDGNVLTTSPVYVPITGDTIFIHKITVTAQEAKANG